MYETQIADKTTKAAEALTAWKSVMAETFQAGGVNGLDEKTWTGQQREKQEKAKAAFVALNTEVAELHKKEKEAKELSEYETFYKEPVRPVNPHSTSPRETNALEGPKEVLHAIQARKANGEEHADKAMWSRAINRFMTPVERQTHRQATAAYLKGDGSDAMARACRILATAFGPQEIQLLSGASGSLGGFSYPEDFRAEVVRPRPGFAVMRLISRVMPTNGDTLVMPRVVSGTDPYSSGVSGAWRSSGYVSGGTAPTVQNQPTLAQERVQVYWWQPNAIELDPSLIDDNAINLESVIGEELGRTKGLDEDSAFVNGTGIGQPLGVRNAGFTAVTLGNDVVSYSTLIDLQMGLPAQYRAGAVHLMRSSVFGAYMKLETGSGVTLIFPGYATTASSKATPSAANLMGYPVHITEFMPALGSVVGVDLFGDFFYYVIAERQDLRVQRLVERFAPNVGILVGARVGGQPVLNDAFRMGTTS
ncbi:MAG: phage major capsid protein [Thermoanaerobaculia bacterium]